MAQWAKAPFETLALDRGVLVQVPATLFLIQLPPSEAEKTVDDGPNIWGPATHLGDQNGVLGSRLCPG